ncbi:hypothetical protein PGTUg99_007584 [Puccinia graminis f. sp. tritici]|uniref:Uncharacterized protein n=1 Tax=Puccinia graminis f. sp. tritici TaxID=56615 RepID=A0A5B0RBH5_PUCGR|nr:hypothetical protein PGTUg99_007584 [Puccinia graminis f. sp. tritici]
MVSDHQPIAVEDLSIAPVVYLYKNSCPHCGLTYWLTMNPCPLHHYPRQLDDNEFGKEDEL